LRLLSEIRSARKTEHTPNGSRGIFSVAASNSTVRRENRHQLHPKYGTPYFALTVMAIVMFSAVTICYYVLVANGFAVLDEFNDAGTMGAFGFVGAYSCIVLAAPAFLKKRGELQPKHIVLCVVAMPYAETVRKEIDQMPAKKSGKNVERHLFSTWRQACDQK